MACLVCSQEQCFQVFIARAGGGQVEWFHPPDPLLPWAPLPGSAGGSFSAAHRPPPQSWLLSVRLRPEQPLRALARVGAAASISLLNYAAAAVGRSTLAGPG